MNQLLTQIKTSYRKSLQHVTDKGVLTIASNACSVIKDS